jgi:membrane protein DedA with SNARE-associated domain
MSRPQGLLGPDTTERVLSARVMNHGRGSSKRLGLLDIGINGPRIQRTNGAATCATIVEMFVPAFHFLFHFHLHFHHFHGSPIDYVGLAAAAIASWVGVPGPGEPVLIATGVLAAKHHLDITGVLLVAWAAATLGGIAGWLLGMMFGRRLLTFPGPLRKLREGAVERGDRIFRSHPVLAIVLTPSWIAGIHHVRARVYLVTNVLSAAAWAAVIGLGAYYIGPSIVDFAGDLGLVTGIALGVLVVLVVGGEVLRRRRRAARARAGAPPTTLDSDGEPG